MRSRGTRSLLAAGLLSLCRGQDMLFARFDAYGTNANTNEGYFTPANVVPSSSFGQQWSVATDGGACYAQVLYVADLQVNGAAHDTAFVATNNNNIFALDASTGTQLWTTSVQRAIYGGVVSPLPNIDTMGVDTGTDAWGVTSTPYIDLPSQSMYVVSTLKEQVAGETISHYYYQLWQLSITTGAVLQFQVIAEETAQCPTPADMCTPVAFVSGPSLPASIAADADANGILHFQVLRQVQRAGLFVWEGNLVVAFAGLDDIVPWHGWVLGFNAATLDYAFIFNTEKNGNAGGVWGAGYHPPVDNDGFMYFSVGNGDWNGGNVDQNGFPNDGNYGNGVLKLQLNPSITPELAAPNGWGLQVVDFFVPYDSVDLSEFGDLDVGSTGVTLVPDGTIAAFPKLLLVCGKNEVMYVIDRTNMGKFNPTKDNVIFELNLNAPTINFPDVNAGVWQGMAFMNDYAYQVISNGPGYQLKLQADGSLTIAYMNSDNPDIVFGYATGAIFGTSSGSQNGILWSITQPLDDGTMPNALRIYDASDFTLLNLIHIPFTVNKFSMPTVVDGRCLFSTHSGDVFSYGCTGSNCPVLASATMPASSTPSPGTIPSLAASAVVTGAPSTTTVLPHHSSNSSGVGGQSAGGPSTTGPIVGGVVGGLGFLAMVAGGVVLLLLNKKKTARRALFNPPRASAAGAGEAGGEGADTLSTVTTHGAAAEGAAATGEAAPVVTTQA